ncbi:MAG: hypothetical protein OEX00_11915 [Gammaproteobacteria bacterium]|nr:hypothetical protein [Gammaproteobacteria bacterium]MDH5693038.1 hypothetical protein [Gammaproteobacteria bacterium]
MLPRDQKPLWVKFGNIRVQERFYSLEGDLMIKTGGNTAVRVYGERESYLFDREDSVKRTQETPAYIRRTTL